MSQATDASFLEFQQTSGCYLCCNATTTGECKIFRLMLPLRAYHRFAAPAPTWGSLRNAAARDDREGAITPSMPWVASATSQQIEHRRREGHDYFGAKGKTKAFCVRLLPATTTSSSASLHRDAFTRFSYPLPGPTLHSLRRPAALLVILLHPRRASSPRSWALHRRLHFTFSLCVTSVCQQGDIHKGSQLHPEFFPAYLVYLELARR